MTTGITEQEEFGLFDFFRIRRNLRHFLSFYVGLPTHREVVGFGFGEVEGDGAEFSPALFGLGLAVGIGEVTIDLPEHEGAEFPVGAGGAFRGVEVGEWVPGGIENFREEILSEVFGGFFRVALAADVGENGEPVNLAEAREIAHGGAGCREDGVGDDALAGVRELVFIRLAHVDILPFTVR